uniref:Ferritin n=1 Tax=Equus asinus TaxID=9793 RepID=A0A9L0I6B9_EQUAS
MAAQVCSLLSEECRVAINHIVSYELHVSDAYLSMACYYDGETKEPPFATFFEDQAEVKRAHARQFLKYLRKHESKICLPVIQEEIKLCLRWESDSPVPLQQRPDIDNWGTGLQALESALELENTLNNLLQDLKTLASENHETDLSRFLGKFLDKQKRNIRYLENQVGYQKELEKLAQKENPSEKTPEASAKEA